MYLMPERHERTSQKMAAGSTRPHFKWTPMATAALLLILACTAGTVYVGVKLYDATSYPVQFNTK